MAIYPPRLRDADNSLVNIDEGESLNLQVTLKDVNDNTINAASVATLTFTLYDYATRAIINAHNSTNVKDNGLGTIASNILTIRLEAADATIVSTDNIPVGATEKHVGRVRFTWNDGVRTRTGGGEVQFGVRHLATPTT